jgi:glycerol-3-phosphate acyltransferase PlsX
VISMEFPKKLRIALDAMGGDYAPEREVAGAVEALRQSGGRFEVVLVGDEALIRQQLALHHTEGLSYSIVHASQVITMKDSPTAALKHKRDSSLSVAMRLHREGKVDAVASGGNTGAVLAASTLILGRVKGVSRPTIGAFIPSVESPVLLLDAGANVDCRARHLFEFAVMGSIYQQVIMKKERPTVGLLNIGEEDSKGTSVAVEAHKLLAASTLNFIGNIEGRDILKGKVNIAVCDGFVGNIVLKFGESVPSFLKGRLRRFADQGIVKKIATAVSLWPLKSSLRDLDPNMSGGVPVLGVNGVSLIGHGSASVLGIKNLILCAAEVAVSQINRQIETSLATVLPEQPEEK